MKFSILIPVYNEKNYILKVLKNVNLQKKNYDLEIIISDDGSTDGTKKILKDNKDLYDFFIDESINQGKGMAVNKAIEKATGDYLLIQDADLEYNPNDYEKMFAPAIECDADVVYGSRFMGGNPHRILFFWHSIGNKMLTTISNMLTNLNLTDMETCYKLVRADLLKSLILKESV